ncbi:MAG: hypothetical protein JO266_21395 [Acidobacteria bacterium]|nr:hypothetical protein [Acidobacteriota bacterium]MBV8894496.1 hypothetical protein [Acidobacteriota bacterium]
MQAPAPFDFRCGDGGMPLKVVFDQEVRIRNVGQPVYGKTAEPIYVLHKIICGQRHWQ